MRKHYKFPIGGAIALLSGLIIAMFTYLEFIVETIKALPKLPDCLSSFENCLDLIEATVHLFPYVALTLGLLIFGLALMFKRRSAVLLLLTDFGIFGTISYLLCISLVLLFHSGYTHMINYIYYIPNYIGWIIVLIAFALFSSFINSTYFRDERCSNVMAWIAAVVVMLGYGILTLGNVVSEIFIFSQGGITFSRLLNFELLITAASTVLLPAVFIIAGIWIANPYKKGVNLDEIIEEDEPAPAPAQRPAPQPAPAQRPAPQPAPAQRPAPKTSPEAALEHKVFALKKYKELLDTGVITQEEFDAKKKQILGL